MKKSRNVRNQSSLYPHHTLREKPTKKSKGTLKKRDARHPSKRDDDAGVLHGRGKQLATCATKTSLPEGKLTASKERETARKVGV